MVRDHRAGQSGINRAGGPMDGVLILEGEVRELIRRRGLDPVRDRPGIDALVADAMADYDERSVLGSVPPLPDPGAAHKAVVDAVAGLGPLQRYLDDPEVEEIWINHPRVTPRGYLCRSEGLTRSAGPQRVRSGASFLEETSRSAAC